jgi:hypothetical protein
VTGNDLIFFADEDRVGETEALDASGNLLDLLFGVSASVSGVGTQVPDAHGLDGHVRHFFYPIFKVTSGRRGRDEVAAHMQSAPEPIGWGAATLLAG